MRETRIKDLLQDQNDDDGRADEASIARARPRHRRRRRGAKRALPPLNVVPTLLTLANLACGFAAIYYALKPVGTEGPLGLQTLTVAGILIFIGMFFDAVDGSVARLTRSTSDIGGQVDSMADMVTFGIAPAFMMVTLVTYYFGLEGSLTILGAGADSGFSRMIWGIAVVYACCTALRLARFNVETPSAAVEDHQVFSGLPSPGAAGAVASLILLHQHLLFERLLSPDEVSDRFARWTAFGIPVIALLCAIAMVTSIPYVHAINRYVRGQRSFGYVAALVIIVFLAVWHFQETVAIAFTVYALWGPLGLVWRKLVRRSDQADSAS